MLKKLLIASLTLGLALHVHAFDKTRMDVDKDFWGKWSINNDSNKCTETYVFIKPGQFTYESGQKKLKGDFALLRSSEPAKLDVLAMRVLQDNKLTGCGNSSGQVQDYTNTDIQLTLKWLSNKKAQLCTDYRW